MSDYAQDIRDQQAADLKRAALAIASKRATNCDNGDPDWQTRLIYNGAKHPTAKAVLANAATPFRHSPEWFGALAYDEFALRVVPVKYLPWGAAKTPRWTDNDDRLATEWLHHKGIFVGVETAGLAVQTVAMENGFHPVRHYLESLEWDGVERLKNWLTTYAGAPDTPYFSAVGARWMIAAIARIFRPGCKADCMLILEAVQGALKSTLFKTLGGNWYTDEIADLGTKDSAMQTAGVWIIEVAELDSMSRSESGRIKAFMSRTTDRFRPPYGRQVIEAPRQCVFAGTVNHASYLKDETGGRRFWPVACGRIDIDALARDRDQLWAEALKLFRDGAKWWLDTDELNRQADAQQQERYEGDAWDELIARWIANPEQRTDASGHPLQPFTSTDESVTVTDVLIHAIGKRPEAWTQADQSRVARSLKSLHWERYKRRVGTNFAWHYRRDT